MSLKEIGVRKYPGLQMLYMGCQLPTLWRVEFGIGVDHRGEKTEQVADKAKLDAFMQGNLLSYSNQVAGATEFLGYEDFATSPRGKATFIALSNRELGLGKYASRKEVLQKARAIGGLEPCPVDTPFFTLMHTDSLCLGHHIAFPHHVFELAGGPKMMMLSKPLDWEYLCCVGADCVYSGEDVRVDWAFMLPEDFFSSPPLLFHQRKPPG